MDDIYSSTIFANSTSSLDFGEGAQMGELGGDEGVGGMGGGGDLDWFHFLFEVFLIFICVVTTLLNLVLMVAIATQSATDSRSQSTPNYAYLIALNLTIINFLVGVCVIGPLVAQMHFRGNETLFGECGCLVYAFLFNIYLVGTPLFMLLNAAERYIAVVYPLRLVTLITRRRLWVAISSVWILLIVYGLMTVFGSGLVLLDGTRWCEIALVGLSAQVSSLVTSLLLVDLPIAGLILFYGVICVKLWRSVSTHKQLQETTAAAGGRSSSNKSSNSAAMVKGKSLANISDASGSGNSINTNNNNGECTCTNNNKQTYNRKYIKNNSVTRLNIRVINKNNNKAPIASMDESDEKLFGNELTVPSRAGEGSNSGSVGESAGASYLKNSNDIIKSCLVSEKNKDERNNRSSHSPMRSIGSRSVTTSVGDGMSSSGGTSIGGGVSGAGGGGSESAMRRRQRTTQMLIITVVSHTMCCVPFNVYTVLQYMHQGKFPRQGVKFDYYLTMWSLPVLFCSSAVNPLVYLAMSKNLRAKITAKLLPCLTKPRASNVAAPLRTTSQTRTLSTHQRDNRCHSVAATTVTATNKIAVSSEIVESGLGHDQESIRLLSTNETCSDSCPSKTALQKCGYSQTPYGHRRLAEDSRL
ncbi:trissin receptor-like isoform X2 [Symsagittifera roscoffensis]|uniref:trissin receptor-like isoform X2 n=1 Tax=Symsagittifera roscoffensis TaxID=84072 RepID=UPI00307CB8CA